MDNLTQPISNMTSIGNGSLETLKGNVEAMMASSHIWTSGCQAIGQTMAASAHAQLERNLSTWKAVTSVKSVKEAMELHAQLTRTSVENVVAATGKLAEASMKLVEQTMEPMTARMTLAAEKLSPPTIRE
jgi:phasin family protein